MAIRIIRKDDDEILRKISKKVEVIDDRILALLDDMRDTMYDAEGVGLAGPQVGVLRRIAIVDVGDGLIELINPVIVFEGGKEIDEEGCLSLPGKNGAVCRPKKVIVRAQNRKGETFEKTGTDLLARAFCHEIDHLNGILFIDKVIPDYKLEEK